MTEHSDSTHGVGGPNILPWALRYARKGFRVFPCRPLGKEPAIKAWQHVATDNIQTVTSWFAEFPDRNLAVATGPQPNGMNLLVIDIDPRHGGDTAWKRLVGEHGGPGEMPQTAIHTTPNGGWHIFLDAPKGFRNSRNKLGEGIDTRAEGGYVLVPPSKIMRKQGEALYSSEAGLWSI